MAGPSHSQIREESTVSQTQEVSTASTFRQGFQWRSFGLSHPKPWILVSDGWGFPKFYAAWRVLWALYHTAWLMYMWVDDEQKAAHQGVWLAYLSNQAYVVLTASTITQAIVVLLLTMGKVDVNVVETPWYLKVTWLLFELSSTGAFLLTGVYFTLIYEGTLTPAGTMKHVANSVYVVLDLCVTATPVRVVHVVYVMIYCTCYVVFTVVYWAAGGVSETGERYLYKVMDWSKPETAGPVAAIGIVVGAPMAHLCAWCLYNVRETVHECVSRRNVRNVHPSFADESKDSANVSTYTVL